MTRWSLLLQTPSSSYTTSWDSTVYDANGNYQSDRDFGLFNVNTNPYSIAWDGAYFYVGDASYDKVYVYDVDGNYQSDRDFNFATGNASLHGIVWDGAYFYVVDGSSDKVYVYDADGTHVG